MYAKKLRKMNRLYLKYLKSLLFYNIISMVIIYGMG